MEITISQDFVTNYFSNRLYSSVWNNASATDQVKAIRWAKTIIEGGFEYYETAYEIDENDSIVWDDRVLAAVCEEAIWLLKQDPTDYPELLTLGLSEGKAGTASMKANPALIAPLICNASIRLIGNLATIVDSECGLGTITSTMLS